jgi:hypothetical protein
MMQRIIKRSNPTPTPTTIQTHILIASDTSSAKSHQAFSVDVQQPLTSCRQS